MWGQKLKTRQAKAELSIAPQSNTAPTVALVKTIVQLIAWVVNLINSLSAISVYVVGGCDYAISTYEDRAQPFLLLSIYFTPSDTNSHQTLMNIIKQLHFKIICLPIKHKEYTTQLSLKIHISGLEGDFVLKLEPKFMSLNDNFKKI